MALSSQSRVWLQGYSVFPDGQAHQQSRWARMWHRGEETHHCLGAHFMGCGEQMNLIHLCAEGSKEPQEADPVACCVTLFPGDGNKSLLISDREPM